MRRLRRENIFHTGTKGGQGLVLIKDTKIFWFKGGKVWKELEKQKRGWGGTRGKSKP